MILRKPYAFLIKYFRIIHIILTALMIFTLTQTNKLYTFFADYIKNSSYLRIYIEPSITSVKWYIYFPILLIIGILTIIFVLMNKKKKPVKFYIFSIIFYFLLIIDLIFTNSQFFSILQNEASLKILTLTKDLLNVFSIIQYAFIAIAFIRGIGFNIKKFDFKNDLKEMSILEEDNEEFEVELAVDTDDIKTKTRRFLRQTRYIIQENKKVIIVLGSGISLYLIMSLFLNVFIYNRVYRENQTFKSNGLSIKITDSYSTTKDYKMNDISSKDKYIYYILKARIKNNTNEVKSLNISNVKLKVSEYKSYDIDQKSFKYFKDFGTGYYKQKVPGKSSGDYIFVFKVEKEYDTGKKTFEVLKKITLQDGEMEYKYTKVKIRPHNINKVKEEKEVALTETLEIDNDILGKLNIKIESMELLDKEEYKYKETIDKKEYTFTKVIQPDFSDYYGKKILKLKTSIDAINIGEEKLKSILGDFGHIRYIKNGKEYDNPFNIIEKTPDSASEYRYIEVTDKIKDADNIWLDIIIRNKMYSYKIK